MLYFDQLFYLNVDRDHHTTDTDMEWFYFTGIACRDRDDHYTIQLFSASGKQILRLKMVCERALPSKAKEPFTNTAYLKADSSFHSYPDDPWRAYTGIALQFDVGFFSVQLFTPEGKPFIRFDMTAIDMGSIDNSGDMYDLTVSS